LSDFRGGAWFITSPEDTIPLTILGDNQTPTFNTLFVIFSSVPGAGAVAENYGQFYGSFAGRSTLTGGMRGSEAEGSPFVAATVSITLVKE